MLYYAGFPDLQLLHCGHDHLAFLDCQIIDSGVLVLLKGEGGGLFLPWGRHRRFRSFGK